MVSPLLHLLRTGLAAGAGRPGYGFRPAGHRHEVDQAAVEVDGRDGHLQLRADLPDPATALQRLVPVVPAHIGVRQLRHVHHAADREGGQVDEQPVARALGDDRVEARALPLVQHLLQVAVLLDLVERALGVVRALLAFGAVERRGVQPAEVEAPALPGDPGRELAVQHEVGIAANRAREMRVVLLRQAEVADVLRRIEGALHGAQHHHRQHALERRVLDLLQELREVLLVGEVPTGDAELREVRAQLLQLVRVRRLVQAREDLHAARPELLRHGLVRRDHALLDHLVRLVVRAHLDAGHHALRVQADLGLGHLHVQRAGREAVAAQLLRERVDREDGLPFRGFQLRGRAARRDDGPYRCRAADEVQDLLVGEAGLGADDGLRELPRDAGPLRVEGQERRERVAVLARDERADAVRELLGQHGDDLVDEVDARGAPVGLAVELAAGLHEMRDVGDVHAQDAVAVLVRLKRERVVVVARGLGVAGEDELLPQVEAARGGRLGGNHADALGLGDDLRRELLGQVVLLHHRKGVERRVVRRADHVRDLGLGGEARVLPAHEAHDDAVAHLRAMRVRHQELLPVGRAERLDAREAPRRGDGAHDRARRAGVDADDAAPGARLRRRAAAAEAVPRGPVLQLDRHGVADERRAEVLPLDPGRLVRRGVHEEARAIAGHVQFAGHRADGAGRLLRPHLLFTLVHMFLRSVFLISNQPSTFNLQPQKNHFAQARRPCFQGTRWETPVLPLKESRFATYQS